MKRIKRRTFSGVVCEQEVYSIRSGAVLKAEPRQRFKDDSEREKHKTEISRKRHNRIFNENFTPNSIYSTLTLDDKHEVHTFPEMKRLRDNYIRVLKRKYPNAVIFAYIGRGESTDRIHMHMVSDGIPEEYIKAKWYCGKVTRTINLRSHCYYDIPGKGKVDHGCDYTGLANYLFDHWTTEVGGHRWKQTINAKKVETDPPKEIKKVYTDKKPPKAPKGYMLVETKSTPYGYLYFKYVIIPKPASSAISKESKK